MEEGDRADVALQQVLRMESRTSPQEKREISQAVYGYFRWYGWLSEGETFSRKLSKVRELETRFREAPESFPESEMLERSVPAWTWEQVEAEGALARAFQARPRLWLRARPGKGEEQARVLGDAELHPILPDAVEYLGEMDLYQTAQFQGGEFEIQDINSQVVGHVCEAKAGQTWWDACAGEGGKTLHLCDMMQNKGLVWASDRAEWRLKILQKRAKRAGLFNYRVKVWANAARPAVKGPFDGVLVDAPCSGVGTWGRNPQARWTTTIKDVMELALVQKQLLSTAAAVLKPGGRLVYSVCTLTRAETTEVVEFINSTQGQLQPAAFVNPLTGERQSSLLLKPQETGGIGMFIAQWQRNS